AACPAEVWKVGERTRQRVMLRRRCPEHGEAEACISSDARFYWLAQGDPKNACCRGNACSASDGVVRGTRRGNARMGLAADAHGSNTDSEGHERDYQNPSVFHPRSSVAENLSTCLALIEIVNSCNLACPTCYADSPRTAHIDAVPLADLQQRIQGVIDR